MKLHLILPLLVGLFMAQALHAQERKPKYGPEYTRRTLKAEDGGVFKYGWLSPAQAKPGEKYPLVVCLHGSGGSVRASSVLTRPEMRKKYPAFVLVGECEQGSVWAFTQAFNRKGRPANTPERLPAVIATVRSLLKTEAIDPQRVYIIGQSLGGAGTWAAIARAPDLFAAAAPICGFWPVEEAARMASVPVWAFHGADDPTVPVQFSRDLTEAVTKAGGRAKYTEYPGVGHDSWMKACEEPELWAWMFAQKKTP